MTASPKIVPRGVLRGYPKPAEKSGSGRGSISAEVSSKIPFLLRETM